METKAVLPRWWGDDLDVLTGHLADALVLIYKTDEPVVLAARKAEPSTFVSRLRAPALGWRDLLGPDRLGQGLTWREAVRRGIGTQAERAAAILDPSMGDE